MTAVFGTLYGASSRHFARLQLAALAGILASTVANMYGKDFDICIRSVRNVLRRRFGVSAPQAITCRCGRTSFSESAAHGPIARREQLGDRVLSEFTTTNDQLNQRLANLGPKDWEKPHFFNSLGIAPLRFRPDLRLFELVLHGWDIRSRLESDVHLPAESLPVLLGLVSGPFTRWLFRPGPRLPAPIRYRFALTGAGAHDTDIVVEGDTATIEPAGPTPATVTCRCNTETFVLIMTGRLLLPDAIAQGRLVAEGDLEWVEAFAQWFGGA